VPFPVADYLLNQKRLALGRLEDLYDVAIHITGSEGVEWDEVRIEATERPVETEALPEEELPEIKEMADTTEPAPKKKHRRHRRKRKKPDEPLTETEAEERDELEGVLSENALLAKLRAVFAGEED